MNDSILTSIKKLLGISEEYEHFDEDVITAINSAFTIVYQIGVGPDIPFFISDSSAVWSDFGDLAEIQAIKSYIHMRTRLWFDTPQTGPLVQSIERNLLELEWRLSIIAGQGGNK